MSKLIRRFYPRSGVSRPMLEAEAKYVAREVEDDFCLSLNDLRQKLSERGEAWHKADEALHAAVLALPERERLAVQCILVRDFHHILELYLEYVRMCQPEGPAPLNPSAVDVPRQPFSEWLFSG